LGKSYLGWGGEEGRKAGRREGGNGIGVPGEWIDERIKVDLVRSGR